MNFCDDHGNQYNPYKENVFYIYMFFTFLLN